MDPRGDCLTFSKMLDVAGEPSREMCDDGITVAVRSLVDDAGRQMRSFQSSAGADGYFPLAHLRVKFSTWRLAEFGNVVESRMLRWMELLATWCRPKVLAVFFRTLRNGWATNRIMISLVDSDGQCALGCDAEDSIGHCCCCSVS